MYKIRNISTGEIFELSARPVWSAGIWECGGIRFVDPSGKGFELVDDEFYLEVSVTAFMLLWTSKERVALKQSRTTAPVIDDFFDILDGAETVDLALNSTQQGVEYCLTFLDGLEGDILAGASVADRKAQILSGELQ